MPEFDIRPIAPGDAAWVERLIVEHWFESSVVAHGVIYYPHELPGFAAMNDELPVGLVTYHMSKDECEIVTLDSANPGIGIGTALLEAVRQEAKQRGCSRLWLVTTNDNLEALGFYQKRGFVLVKVHRNAIERSRKLKPAIPLYGLEGIPIRDEIELEMSSWACPPIFVTL